MDRPIDAVGVRVIGALIEKELTTPDSYPLTLNALVAACNQTSNRDPVMVLDETTVSGSLDELSRRSLTRGVHRSDSRVMRYRHLMTETMKLHAAETAVMCVLMLRGAQTTGEIKIRTARLFPFPDLKHVEVTLQSLITLTTPLVAQLPRQPGQKEVRYAHLLSGEPEIPAFAASDNPDTIRGERASRIDRVDALEQAVEALRAELAELRAHVDELRST